MGTEIQRVSRPVALGIIALAASRLREAPAAIVARLHFMIDAADLSREEALAAIDEARAPAIIARPIGEGTSEQREARAHQRAAAERAHREPQRVRGPARGTADRPIRVG